MVSESDSTKASIPTDENDPHASQPTSAFLEAPSTQDEYLRQNELTDAQLRAIEDEQKQTPLIGEKLPFETIVAEYERLPDACSWVTKAKELASTYGHVRQVRRDGNCFYRSVLASIHEHILKDPAFAKKHITICKGWVDRLMKLGFPDWTTTDFCETYNEWIVRVANKEMNEKEIFEKLRDEGHCNYLIIFLRLITSGYLKEHSEEYAPFIDNGQSLADYCASEIESMWKDTDHLGITGLVHALDLPIRVEYLDQSAAPDGGLHYDFPPDQSTPPTVVLLYRPGHYELIYRR